MLRSEGSASKLKLWTDRACLAVFLLIATFVLIAPASAQDFTLTATAFSPDATAPGGTLSSTISMVAGSGFVGPVTLACTVTPDVQITSTTFPVCTVSPTSLTGTGGASFTITTTGTTPQVGYTVTITGTDASGSVASPPLALTVLGVTPQFTITILTAVAPSSVVAGTGATGVVTVNPLDGYTTPTAGGITLYCGSITPLVIIAPVCSFSTNTQGGLTLTGNTPVSSTLTINTYGPVPTGAAVHPRSFYALWLPVPMLAFVGLGAALGGKNSRRVWGVLALFIVGGAILLLPACSNTTGAASTTTPNGVTPANSYTFTIVGVDSNGVASSNTSTTSTGPTVSLSVTAPK